MHYSVFFRKPGAVVGIGDRPSGEPVKIDANDMWDIVKTIIEFGGVAYDTTGSWKSDMTARVFKDSSKSRY